MGELVFDARRTPDTRWYGLSNGGFISSTQFEGQPPPGSEYANCGGVTGAEPPTSIRLSATPFESMVWVGDSPPGPSRPGTYWLNVTGDRVNLVGFAARTKDGPLSWTFIDQEALTGWHQVAFTSILSDDDGSSLPPNSQRIIVYGSEGSQSVDFVAVVCLGSDEPTGVIDAVSAAPTTRDGGTELLLTPEEGQAVADVACRRP